MLVHNPLIAFVFPFHHCQFTSALYASDCACICLFVYECLCSCFGARSLARWLPGVMLTTFLISLIHSPINRFSLPYLFSSTHIFARFAIFNSAVLRPRHFIMLICRAQALQSQRLNQIIKCHHFFSLEKVWREPTKQQLERGSKAGKQTASSWQSQLHLSVSPISFRSIYCQFLANSFATCNFRLHYYHWVESVCFFLLFCDWTKSKTHTHINSPPFQSLSRERLK